LSDDIVLRVLGPVEARAGGGWLAGPPQQRLLLAVLAMQAGRVVPVSELIDAVWDEAPPRSAQASVQALVTRLRRILAGLPGGGIQRCGDGYRLRIEPGEVDVQRFRSLARAGREACDGLAAVAALDQALALWRGAALADVPGTAKIEAIRSGLAQERLSAMQDRIGALLELGRDREAAEELTGLLAGHPMAEGLAGMLMVALHRCGRQADALQVFRDMRRRLSSELAVEPGPELQRLHQRILAGDHALAAAAGGPARTIQPLAEEEEQPAAVGDGPLAVPRQLPAAVPHFTGRAAEIGVLSGLLGQAGLAGGTVVISAIGGTAGVGKTALAVHWAHQVASSFPDGQLYVNLRAFGPSGPPVTAAEAVRGFLDAVGVPGDRIPVGLEAQAALYRSMLAGKRMLVVLDNAGDEEQVRPLLPGSAGCLVVVTSRRSLAGLAAAEGALLLALDVMSEAEASELLAARLGAGRAAAEPEAVGELAVLCARLPLALAVAAVRAAASPARDLVSLAGQLRDMRGRLDVLDAEDPASSIRAVFSWSYQNLSGPAARMFRLLGVHPGPDISVAAAASLAGIPRAQARRAFAELTGAHLLAEQAGGRWAFHDLLRAYATEKAEAGDDQPERRAAARRALDHYLHTAWSAALMLQRSRDPAFVLAPPQNGTDLESIRDSGDAMAWYRAEHQVLLAVIEWAVSLGMDAHAWRLPWALTDYFARTGHWRDLSATQRTALAAARRLGDRAGQARAHQGLGCAQLLARPGQASHSHLDQALSLYRELGDQVGQANIHFKFGMALEHQRRPQEALGHARQVLGLARAAGHRGEEAAALNMIGWLHAQLGDYRQALARCQRALVLHREVGDRHGEAAAWDSVGYISHQLGDHEQAAAYYRQALRLSREVGCRHSQAAILDHLGDSRDAAGDPQAARETWRQALAVLDDLHHPDAGQLRRKLRDHEISHPAPAAAALLRGQRAH
jgi:DNA-binding SARP family transcriptional activator/tetratricopeptide (TPR) repeat protein